MILRNPKPYKKIATLTILTKSSKCLEESCILYIYTGIPTL